MHLKIALIIAACSVVGTVASVLLALNLPQFYLKMYIGAILSVPLSAWTVKVMKTGKLRILIGCVTLLLGMVAIWKTLV